MHQYLKEFLKMFKYVCKTDTTAHLRPPTRYSFCPTYEFIDDLLILYGCVIDSTYMVPVYLNMCLKYYSDKVIYQKKNKKKRSKKT